MVNGKQQVMNDYLIYHHIRALSLNIYLPLTAYRLPLIYDLFRQ